MSLLGPLKLLSKGDILASSSTGQRSPWGHYHDQKFSGCPDSLNSFSGPSREFPGRLLFQTVCYFLQLPFFLLQLSFIDDFLHLHVSVLGLHCTVVQFLTFPDVLIFEKQI